MTTAPLRTVKALFFIALTGTVSTSSGILFCLTLCSPPIYANNLIPNSGFEQDTVAPIGKPDYYGFSSESCQGIETDPSKVYAGSRCALFDSASSLTCYYSAFYTADSAAEDYPYPETQKYELSVRYKTDADFVGDGISLQILFWEDGNAIGEASTADCISSNSWSLLKLRTQAKGRANQISARVHYSGSGKAWIDELQLTPTGTTLCRNGGFEDDRSTPTGKPDYFKPRSTYTANHLLETDLAETYLGAQAARFEMTTDDGCYYHGPYNAAGSTQQAIPACPGDSFRITGMGRVASYTGTDGVQLSLIFWNNGSVVERIDSIPNCSTNWAQMDLTADAPATTDALTYFTKFKGIGSGWIDEVQLVRDNPVINSSFETDSTSDGIPDFWYPLPAAAGILGIETNAPYSGIRCAAIQNTVPDESSFFVGPADADSGTPAEISVLPGDEYSLCAQVKTATDFSGVGVRASLIFLNDGEIISRVDSEYLTHTDWTNLTLTASVPAGADDLLYQLESSGTNSAWFDQVELFRTDRRWCYQDAPIDFIEDLPFTNSLIDGSAISNKFYEMHNDFETCYNNDGSWGETHLVRMSANAAVAYIHAFNVIPDPAFTNRATEALNWLLDQQQSNGSFPWYKYDPPVTVGDSIMYMTGLAGEALSLGSQTFSNPTYEAAAADVCDYFMTKTAAANANFNAFAIIALTAYCEHVSPNQDYMDRALYFADCMMAGQMDSGMWTDEHNQLIWYHSIMTRSLVQLEHALPSDHPKRKAIEHRLYAALNHIVRSQLSTGKVLTTPTDLNDPTRFKPQPTRAVCTAHKLLGINDLSNSVNTASKSSSLLSADTDNVQGHEFAALGVFLNYIYGN